MVLGVRSDVMGFIVAGEKYFYIVIICRERLTHAPYWRKSEN